MRGQSVSPQRGVKQGVVIKVKPARSIATRSDNDFVILKQ
jgi:hypothetical protein